MKPSGKPNIKDGKPRGVGDQLKPFEDEQGPSWGTTSPSFIEDHSTGQWKLLKATKTLLNYQCDTPFPPYRDKPVLGNDMGDFFVKKIADICSTLNSQNTASILTPEESNSVVFAGPIFTSFSSLTEDSLSKLMASAPKMTCLLDPIPTKLVRDSTWWLY